MNFILLNHAPRFIEQQSYGHGQTLLLCLGRHKFKRRYFFERRIDIAAKAKAAIAANEQHPAAGFGELLKRVEKPLRQLISGRVIQNNS